MNRLTSFGLAAALLVGLAGRAQAAIIISVDENGAGVGTVGLGFLAADPGPSGLASALTYTLPAATVVGDVYLTEPSAGGVLADLVRFNGTTLVLYSDKDDVPLLPADVGFPKTTYANLVGIVEVGPEGANGATYTPLPGQPGFIAGGVTYQITSDGPAAVPEPSPIALTSLIGALGAGGLAWKRRKAATLATA